MSSPQELRARILARVWQAIAKQGISATQISQDRLDTLADDIAEGVMAEIGSVVESGSQTRGASDARRPAANLSPQSPQEEQILWEGRPLLSLTKRYVISTQRIRVITGLLSRTREDIELIRIQDIDQWQSFGQRLLGIGTIDVASADPNTPHTELKNIRHPLDVHEIIRTAMLAQRRDTNFAFRQEFGPSDH
ncbi:MAG: PH domain-containing protein [Anaerolineae bacterium]